MIKKTFEQLVQEKWIATAIDYSKRSHDIFKNPSKKELNGVLAKSKARFSNIGSVRGLLTGKNGNGDLYVFDISCLHAFAQRELGIENTSMRITMNPTQKKIFVVDLIMNPKAEVDPVVAAINKNKNVLAVMGVPKEIISEKFLKYGISPYTYNKMPIFENPSKREYDELFQGLAQRSYKQIRFICTGDGKGAIYVFPAELLHDDAHRTIGSAVLSPSPVYGMIRTGKKIQWFYSEGEADSEDITVNLEKNKNIRNFLGSSYKVDET